MREGRGETREERGERKRDLERHRRREEDQQGSSLLSLSFFLLLSHFLGDPWLRVHCDTNGKKTQVSYVDAAVQAVSPADKSPNVDSKGATGKERGEGETKIV